MSLRYAFHHVGHDRYVVYDKSADGMPILGTILRVEGTDIGRGMGYIVVGDLTEYFYETAEDAADFLAGTAFKMREPG